MPTIMIVCLKLQEEWLAAINYSK